MAHLLDHDGLAGLTRNNEDLKMIYPDFGSRLNDQFIFGIEEPKGMQL